MGLEWEEEDGKCQKPGCWRKAVIVIQKRGSRPSGREKEASKENCLDLVRVEHPGGPRPSLVLWWRSGEIMLSDLVSGDSQLN
jgi:hypothetical protein